MNKTLLVFGIIIIIVALAVIVMHMAGVEIASPNRCIVCIQR